MLYTIPQFLAKLEEDIQGTEHRKSGQSKKQFADRFGTSLSLVYTMVEKAETGSYFVLCDPETGISRLLRTIHQADLVI